MTLPIALVVDDNPLNLESLNLLLAKEGVQTVAARSPHEMFAQLDKLSHVDVVFLDLEFPNSDGFQLIHELRAQPALANVPIIAYTVHTSEQNEAQAAGFDGFIGKPLNVNRFPDQLRRILNGESVWEIG